jgi:hypothetical protein
MFLVISLCCITATRILTYGNDLIRILSISYPMLIKSFSVVKVIKESKARVKT